VTDGRFHALAEIIAAMSMALGRTPPRFALPVKPARWAVGCLEDASKWIGHATPLGRAIIDKYIEDIAVSGEKIRVSLDFCPHYDLLSGWRETVEGMRQAGEL